MRGGTNLLDLVSIIGPGASAPAGPVSIDTLSEAMNSAISDNWTSEVAGTAAVSYNAGRMVVVMAGGGNDGVDFTSVLTDITDSFIDFDPSQDVGTDVWMEMSLKANNNFSHIRLNSNLGELTLDAKNYTGDLITYVKTYDYTDTIAYKPAVHKFWRIRHGGTNFYVETSVDKTDWVTRWTLTAANMANMVTNDVIVTFELWNYDATESTASIGEFVGAAGGTGTPITKPDAIANLGEWYDVPRQNPTNNTTCASLTDYSGNNRHFVQATETNKPTFKTNIINGYPIVRADGNDNWLARTITLGTKVTIFFVCTPSTVGNAYFIGGNQAASKPAFITNFSSTPMQWYNDNGQSYGTLTGFHIFMVQQQDATSLIGRLDGVEKFNLVPAVSINGKSFTYMFSSNSAANYAAMDFAEGFIFNDFLTLADVKKMERYLSDRYALPITQ